MHLSASTPVNNAPMSSPHRRPTKEEHPQRDPRSAFLVRRECGSKLDWPSSSAFGPQHGCQCSESEPALVWQKMRRGSCDRFRLRTLLKSGQPLWRRSSIETFGTGSDDVAVCELVGLVSEQHCRAKEAFDTHSDDVSVSELNDVEPRQHLIREGTQHQDFFADVNVTLRVALERSVSAAPVPAEPVQLFADVNVTLRVALERSVVDPLA